MHYYIRPTMFPLRCTMRTTRLGGIKLLRFRWWFPPRALPPWWYERPPPSQSSNSLFGNLSMSSSLLGITPSAFRALISLCMRETTHGAQHNAVAKSVLSNIPSRCSATALELWMHEPVAKHPIGKHKLFSNKFPMVMLNAVGKHSPCAVSLAYSPTPQGTHKKFLRKFSGSKAQSNKPVE